MLRSQLFKRRGNGPVKQRTSCTLNARHIHVRSVCFKGETWIQPHDTHLRTVKPAHFTWLTREVSRARLCSFRLSNECERWIFHPFFFLSCRCPSAIARYWIEHWNSRWDPGKKPHLMTLSITRHSWTEERWGWRSSGIAKSTIIFILLNLFNFMLHSSKTGCLNDLDLPRLYLINALSANFEKRWGEAARQWSDWIRNRPLFFRFLSTVYFQNGCPYHGPFSVAFCLTNDFHFEFMLDGRL